MPLPVQIHEIPKGRAHYALTRGMWLLPGAYLHDKARFVIPIERIDPATSVLTYVVDDERVNLPLSEDRLEETAALWDGELVTTWFGIDPTKVFFFVPQIAAYQGRIHVTEADYEAT